MNCYLCAAPNATKPLELKDSFTAHSNARCPDSKYLCDRCEWVLNVRFWYWNPNKNQYSAIYGRGTSYLIVGNQIVFPKIGEYRTEKAGKQGTFTLQEISELPTRAQMREWLINPPQPPFTICLAESGQKHVLPWALEANSRDYFPVQFELDTLHIYRSAFTHLLTKYEYLMELGFSKTEINSGNYRSDRLAKCINEYASSEAVIASKRGSRLLELVGYVAIAPTQVQPAIANHGELLHLTF